MKPRLTQNLSEADKQAIKMEWGSCPTFRAKLVAILEEEIERSLMEMRDGAKAPIPNLSEYYADELSKQRTLEWVKSYLV